MEISKVKLGSGGCGSVWLGRVGGKQQSAGQPVQLCAIKKTVKKNPTNSSSMYSPSPSPRRGRSLQPQQEDDSPETNRLQFSFRDESSEGAVLQTLGPNLPNIIPCPCPGPASFGEVEYVPLQLMDSDLAKEVFTLKNTVKDVDTLQHIIRSLLSALQATHQGGYAHRDVKPANLLLERTTTTSANAPSLPFTVYLSDFGSAHGLTDDVRRSSLELKLRGTCRYQAPEQVWQGPLKASTAASCDIWATGLCLFEVCTGQPLFKGERGVELIHSMFDMLGTSYADFPRQTGPVKLRSTIAAAIPWLPEEGLKLMEVCLQLEGRKRPSAMELLKHSFFTASAGVVASSNGIDEEVEGKLPVWSIQSPKRNFEANLAGAQFEDVAVAEQARLLCSSDNSIHWSQQKASATRGGCDQSAARSAQRGGGLFDSSSFLNSSTETVVGATGNGHRLTLGNRRTNDIFADMSTTRGKKGRDESGVDTSTNTAASVGEGRRTVPFVMDENSTLDSTLGSPGKGGDLSRQGTQQFFDQVGSQDRHQERSPKAHKQLFFDPATPQPSPPRTDNLDTAVLF